jgi:biopolymer transport protein ExbD
MARRKHRKLVQQAELDITAFMNLMIVLVPVLLLSMVFSQTAVLDLNFPVIDEENLPQNSEELQLQLLIHEDSLTLADTKQGLIRKIQSGPDGYDFDSLVKVLKQLKNRFPEKTDITLLLAEEIDYQTLVTVMDLTRSYETVVAASVVNAELFPDISIGDAPLVDENIAVEGSES